MDTQRRVEIYGQQPRITSRMNRRLAKKAGKDPMATVIRDAGTVAGPGFRNRRVLLGYERRPVA